MIQFVPQKSALMLFGLPTLVQWENDGLDPAYEKTNNRAWLAFERKTGNPVYAEPVTLYTIEQQEDGRRLLVETFGYHIRNKKGEIVNWSKHPGEDKRYLPHWEVQEVLRVLKHGGFLQLERIEPSAGREE